jgi:endogenous inhibitor of DNA gyrase (YacG/DUF329 family)
MTDKKLKVNCPCCKESFEYYSSRYRPFCTERCKLVDMGHWFDESYTITGKDNTVYIENAEALQTLVDETNEEY